MFSVISGTRLPLCRDAISVFCCPKPTWLDRLDSFTWVWQLVKKKEYLELLLKVLIVCKSRDAFDVFYRPSRLCWKHFLRLNRYYCPVGWGCRIHRVHLCRGVRPYPNECPGYDIKKSDGEVPVMLELWGTQSPSSLLLLSGPLCPEVVAPDRAQSMG